MLIWKEGGEHQKGEWEEKRMCYWDGMRLGVR